MAAEPPFVRVEALAKRYVRRATVRGPAAVEALAGVDLTIERGAMLALVGQSGSGKSTLARCVALIEEPTSGHIWLDGVDTATLDAHARRLFRERVQLVFQDSASALSPRLTAVEIVSEPLDILRRGDRASRRRRSLELLETVGLSPSLASRRPLELSGGQRQRLAVARALAVEPRLLILDEAFTGLDASIQAQIAGLLDDLRRERDLTCLCISHDLALMAAVADEVAILFEGRVVERAPPARLFAAPGHPHARALVAAVPVPPFWPRPEAAR
jgi:peptide/nickel transport system ATP-binding protein